MASIVSDYREQSEFNMAVSTLNRINYSLYLCSEHRRKLDFESLFIEIQNLYAEVSTEMKGDATSLTEKYFDIPNGEVKKKELNNEFSTMEKLIEDTEIAMSKYKRKPTPILSHELHKKLLTIEIFLRKILKEAGLYLKVRDDPRFSLMR